MLQLNTTGWRIYRRLAVGTITGVFLWKLLNELQPGMKRFRVELFDAPELPQKIIDMGKEIAKQMKIQNPERIELFYHAGFKSLHAGNSNLPGGAVIGIPRPFMFTTEEDIRRTVLFYDQEIDWETKAGVLLQRFMVPSEPNLRFVLAHELYSVSRSIDYKEEYFVFPAWFGVNFAMGELILALNSKRVGSLPMTGVFMLIIVYCLSIGCYTQLIRHIRHSRVYDADKFAAEFDKQAGMGGINYLGRLVKINQILRAFHGGGEEIYTKEGDELFRTSKYPPLTNRIEKLEKTLGFSKIKIPTLF